MQLNTLLAATLLLFTSAAVVAAPVNVNTASAAQIAAALNGIGNAKAAAIVAYREQHGRFSAPEQLTEVSGIGTKLLDKIRPDLVFGEPQ